MRRGSPVYCRINFLPCVPFLKDRTKGAVNGTLVARRGVLRFIACSIGPRTPFVSGDLLDEEWLAYRMVADFRAPCMRRAGDSSGPGPSATEKHRHCPGMAQQAFQG